ncbi:hypothetical protein [Bacillus albus]|uniref:hypothetical protein n=1 Tax=Bacillus albus TaxID=2026189 RepID=UPI001021555A|nr:hypothetical protein [Bacillus albus]
MSYKEDKERNPTKIVKSVAFQLADPTEYKLYHHAINQGVYFSAYMKRLIQRDLIERKERDTLSVEDLKKWKNSAKDKKKK